MNEDNLTFLVTVTYRCENMIDRATLDEVYGGSPLEAYRNISDDFNDAVFGFGDTVGDPKVEIEALNKQA